MNIYRNINEDDIIDGEESNWYKLVNNRKISTFELRRAEDNTFYWMYTRLDKNAPELKLKTKRKCLNALCILFEESDLEN